MLDGFFRFLRGVLTRCVRKADKNGIKKLDARGNATHNCNRKVVRTLVAIPDALINYILRYLDSL